MTWFYQDFVKYYLPCRKRFSSARLLDSDDPDPALVLPAQAAFLLEKPELRIPILTNWQQVDFLSVDRRDEGSAGDINVIKRHGSKHHEDDVFKKYFVSWTWLPFQALDKL